MSNGVKILFTHSYFLHFDVKQLKTAMPYPPLATLYAMAYLRERGYEVKLFDTQFLKSPDEIINTLNDFEPRIVVVYDDSFNYLTKMCLTNMRYAAFKMQQYAKQLNCSVFVSSSDATDHCENYLKNGADAVIIGEAEQTLLELCNAFVEKASVKNVQGIVFLDEKKVTHTAKRLVLKDLNQLPMPAWDLLDIKPYREMWMQKHGYFAINFVTTRGCPYKCNWCAKPVYGNRYNSHSAENVVKQLQLLQVQFGFTHVWFADDIFGLKPNWLKEFNHFVKLNQLNIKFKIQSRADLLVNEVDVKYLAESGCEKVWMGAESGSQKILDAMDKGITVAQIYKAAELLNKYKIQVALFLQFGYLHEDVDDINQTLKMVTDIMPDDLGISVSYPLPGTKFYEKVKQELKQKSNWTDSNDLDLMFKNTYSKQFYKVLHSYVHKKYRVRKAKLSIKNFLSKENAKHLLALPYHYIELNRIKSKLKRLEPVTAKSLD